jgi:hypothetical protein
MLERRRIWIVEVLVDGSGFSTLVTLYATATSP